MLLLARGGFKYSLPRLPYLFSHFLPGAGPEPSWLAEAGLCCLAPATQQPWITCADDAPCSISAPSPPNAALSPSWQGVRLCLCTPPPLRLSQRRRAVSLQTKACAFLSKSL